MKLSCDSSEIPFLMHISNSYKRWSDWLKVSVGSDLVTDKVLFDKIICSLITTAL